MNEPTLEQMMQDMANGRKESFYVSLVIFTVIAVVCLVPIFILMWSRLAPALRGSRVLKLLAVVVIILYIGAVCFRYYAYRHRGVNEMPWQVGIYQAYYECSKCGSLHGGIYGKGPTRHKITDTRCVHDWQAIHKEDFDTKCPKLPGLIKIEPTVGIGILQVSLNRDIPIYRDTDSAEAFDTLRFPVVKSGEDKGKFLIASGRELGIDYFPGHSDKEAEQHVKMGLVGLGPHLSFPVVEERDGMYRVILNDRWDTAVIRREDDRELYLRAAHWEWDHGNGTGQPSWFLYETWETHLKRMEYVSADPAYGELRDAPGGERIKRTGSVQGRVAEMDGQWIRIEENPDDREDRPGLWVRWTDGVELFITPVAATYE